MGPLLVVLDAEVIERALLGTAICRRRASQPQVLDRIWYLRGGPVLVDLTLRDSRRSFLEQAGPSKRTRKRNPHHRLTTPEDVARRLVALCHPATYWMTGNTLRVDGGESIVG